MEPFGGIMEKRKQCQKCLCWFPSDSLDDNWPLCPLCGDLNQLDLNTQTEKLDENDDDLD